RVAVELAAAARLDPVAVRAETARAAGLRDEDVDAAVATLLHEELPLAHAAPMRLRERRRARKRNADARSLQGRAHTGSFPSAITSQKSAPEPPLVASATFASGTVSSAGSSPRSCSTALSGFCS